MIKSLQILFGLVLILVLAYIAFLDVSSKIKDNLLTKTETTFSENNVRNVTANVQGEGLSIRRSLVLTGTAISKVERVRIAKVTENIEGVYSVDNQIALHLVVPKIPTRIKAPVGKISTESVMPKSLTKEIEVIEHVKKEPNSYNKNYRKAYIPIDK